KSYAAALPGVHHSPVLRSAGIRYLHGLPCRDRRKAGLLQQRAAGGRTLRGDEAPVSVDFFPSRPLLIRHGILDVRVITSVYFQKNGRFFTDFLLEQNMLVQG